MSSKENLVFPSQTKLNACLEQHPLIQNPSFSENFLIGIVVKTFANTSKHPQCILSEMDNTKSVLDNTRSSCLRNNGELSTLSFRMRAVSPLDCSFFEKEPIQQLFFHHLRHALADCAQENTSLIWKRKVEKNG